MESCEKPRFGQNLLEASVDTRTATRAEANVDLTLPFVSPPSQCPFHGHATALDIDGFEMPAEASESLRLRPIMHLPVGLRA